MKTHQSTTTSRSCLQNWQQLQPGQALPENTLRLPQPYTSVHLTQVLRVVPGRRVVCLGQWKQKAVIVKMMLDRRHQRHASKEIKGLMQLQDQHINTPSILYCGAHADYRHCTLVITAFVDAPSLQQQLATASTPSEQARWLTLLLEAFAACFTGGLVYHDCHYDNFLIDQDKIVFLDGSAVIKTSARIPTSGQIQQISRLLAQLSPSRLASLTPLLANALPLIQQHQRRIEQLCQQIQQQRLQQCLQKCQRSTSQHRQLRQFTQRVILRRDFDHGDLSTWLDKIDQQFQQAHQLKRGNSATVIKTKLNGQAVVIKRYNMKNTWHYLKRMFRRTRAEHAWCQAHCLAFFDIASVQPIGFVEKRWGWLKRQSYFIYQYQPGQRADLILNDEHCSPERQQALIEAMSQLVLQLRQAKISHGDLKAANFIVGEDNQVRLIDLDAVKWHRTQAGFAAKHRQDCVRFMQNWGHNPSLKQQVQQAWQHLGIDIPEQI